MLTVTEIKNTKAKEKPYKLSDGQGKGGWVVGCGTDQNRLNLACQDYKKNTTALLKVEQYITEGRASFGSFPPQ